MKDKYLIAFDTETTGLQKNAGMTELGAVKIDLSGKFIDSFDEFSDPGIKIGDYVQKLTGISNEMIKGAPKPYIVIEHFFKWAGKPENCILLAHKSDFDVEVLCSEMENNKKEIINYRVTDTLSWVKKKLDFKCNKLEHLVEEIGYKPLKSHRAMYDSFSTIKLAEYIIKNVEKPESKEELWRLLLSKSEFFLNIHNKRG